MRQWIRSHLTYANVMATVAVFLVLGGGTALGAFVVSSNTQIGPGTVSGHSPPSGKHANVIAGSVNGTDLANSAVTAGKLGANSVNGSKVTDGSITGADVAESTFNGSQIGGVDAATLGGKSSTDFLPSSAAKSGRVAVNDPFHNDANGVSTTLVNTGPIEVDGFCMQDGATVDLGQVLVSIPGGSITFEVNGGPGQTVTDAGAQTGLINIADPDASNVNEVQSVHLIAVPASGKAVTGDVSVEINDSNGGGSDCTYGYDLVGG